MRLLNSNKSKKNAPNPIPKLRIPMSQIQGHVKVDNPLEELRQKTQRIVIEWMRARGSLSQYPTMKMATNKSEITHFDQKTGSRFMSNGFAA